MIQGAAGVEQVGFDGANGAPKPLGDGFQGQILLVAHDKHGALVGSQRG